MIVISHRLLLFIFSNTKKASTVIGTGFQAGDPREIRTPDTLIRSQVLYPAELLGQIGRGRGTQTPNLRFWRPLLYQLRYAPICLMEVIIHVTCI